MLVGQSILPLAYVVVGKTDSSTSKGINIVGEDKVIDIRPFFRTTELSYNERAGVGAAMPSLSLANPAVGKAQLDYEVRRVHSDYNAKINDILRKLNKGGSQTSPREVATGYLFGGYFYGVEGAYIDFLSQKANGGNLNQLKAEFVKRNGLPSNTEIPDLPNWDISKPITAGNYTEKGEFPNDYINTHVQRHTINPADFGCFIDKNRSARAAEFGTENIVGKKGHVCIHYVSKTIFFDKNAVSWMGDYVVDVQLWNCVPLSSRGGPHANNKTATDRDWET